MQQYYNIPDIKNRDIRRLARRSLREKWGMAILPMLIITLALTLPSLVQYWDLMSSGLLDGSTQDITAMMEEMNNSKAGPLSSVLSFFSFLCTGAFSLAAAALSVRILRNESFDVKTAFVGFGQFIQAFLVDILTSLFSLFWALITIVPGTVIFIVSMNSPVLSLFGILVFILTVIVYILIVLRYSMAFFIAQDNPDLPSLHSIRYSVTLMKGRIGKYFLLQLSFIGWVLLAVIPMSFGLVFLSLSSGAESGLLKIIGVCLVLIGFVTVAMVQLYINTAEAVFYSAVSGNFSFTGAAGTDEENPAVSGQPADQQIVKADEDREGSLPAPAEGNSDEDDVEKDDENAVEEELESSGEGLADPEDSAPASAPESSAEDSVIEDSVIEDSVIEDPEKRNLPPEDSENSPSVPAADEPVEEPVDLAFTFEKTPDAVRGNGEDADDGLLIFVDNTAAGSDSAEGNGEDGFSDDFLDELMKLDADADTDNSGDWHLSKDQIPEDLFRKKE